MQNFALVRIELHEVCTDSPFKPVHFTLDGSTLLQCISCTTQLGFLGKLAESALSPTVHVADKDIK